jgi:hypothetical protein
LWSRLTQAKPQLSEDALTLTHAQSDLVALREVCGQQLAVPQVSNMTEITGATAQVAFQCSPLLGIQASRSAMALTIAHAVQSVFFKAFDPTLNGAPVFTKKIGNLLATLAARQKQQAVQSMVITRLVGPGDLLLDGYLFALQQSIQGNMRQYLARKISR